MRNVGERIQQAEGFLGRWRRAHPDEVTVSVARFAERLEAAEVDQRVAELEEVAAEIGNFELPLEIAVVSKGK